MKYAVNLWEPGNVFRNFASVFPGVFDPEASEAARSPKVDVFNDGGNFVVSAELPGVSREDLDIDVKDNRLTIKGEKKLLRTKLKRMDISGSRDPTDCLREVSFLTTTWIEKT